MVRTTRMAAAASLALAVLTTPIAVGAGEPGEAGMLSLRLGVGAREAGMGGTGVASSYGAAAAYWNPANLVFRETDTELILQHHRYLGLFDQESAAVTHKTSHGVLGFLFSGLWSDEIDRYGSEPVGVPEGTFRPYDLAFGASYSRGIGDSFAAGVMAKLLYQRIDVYSDTGFALDLFVTHRSTMIDGLYFAASATNLGGKMTLNQEPFALPRTFTLGAAWEPPNLLDGSFTFAGDLMMPNDANTKAHVGVEFRVVPQLSLRLGSKVNYQTQGWTAGAGFRIGIVEIGYAYEDSKTDGLDGGHKFALELH
jgi:hypothetical protein